MIKPRRSRVALAASNIICLLLGSLAQVDAAEPLKKMRIAIPSIVIDSHRSGSRGKKGFFAMNGSKRRSPTFKEISEACSPYLPAMCK